MIVLILSYVAVLTLCLTWAYDQDMKLILARNNWTDVNLSKAKKQARSEYYQPIRWWIARKLDKYTNMCWADLALWAMYGNTMNLYEAFQVRNACRKESETHKSTTCWCGKYCKGKQYKETNHED